MDCVFFLRKWDADGKENTWSGTPNGILTALKENTDLKNLMVIDLNYGCVDECALKGTRGFLKILSIDGCDVVERHIESKLANKKLRDIPSKGPIIVFAECQTKRIEDTYVFIDCSVDYAYRCQIQSNEFSKYVPFSQKRKYSLLSMRKSNAQQFYNRCKGIFTMGNWLADDLVDNTGIRREKVHCVGGGANVPKELINSSKKQGNKFLFVGKDFERKNGKLVLDAFSELRNQYGTQFELYIAGPNVWPMKEEIPQGVHFLGLKSTTELAEYFNICDVFVMPSKFEAYGIVFAEALIYGLPIIGRDAFAMKDFVQQGENGFLLESNSVEELAKLMYDAITDSNMRNHVIANKEKYLEKYSWQTVVGRIIDVMRNDGYEI